jgi:hypothetical protein
VICANALPATVEQVSKLLNLFGYSVGEWCNGSTTDSDSVCLGSNPGSPASFRHFSAPAPLYAAR